MQYARVAKVAWEGWNRDRADGMSASLAFYSLLSLVPLITVAMSLATWSLGSASARSISYTQISAVFGKPVAEVFNSILDAGSSSAESVIAALLGLFVLIIAVSGLAGELRSALNLIWGVPTKPESVVDMLRNRTRAFVLVLALAVLVLAVSILSIATAAAGKFVVTLLPAPEWVLTLGNFGISLALLFGVFLLIHHYVPDADVTWRQAAAAATCTALLFTIGKEIVVNAA